MSNDLNLDDLGELPDETDDDYVRLRKTDLDAVRKAAKRSRGLEEQVQTFQRRDAIRDAGLTGLTERQLDVLTRTVDEATPDALRTLAADLGFIEPPATPPAPSTEEIEDAGKVAAAVGGSTAPVKTTISPGDTRAWPADRRMRFTRDHPALAERLLRGDTVEAPPGYAA